MKPTAANLIRPPSLWLVQLKEFILWWWKPHRHLTVSTEWFLGKLPIPLCVQYQFVVRLEIKQARSVVVWRAPGVTDQDIISAVLSVCNEAQNG